MFSRTVSFVLGLLLLTFSFQVCSAQEPPQEPQSAPSIFNAITRLDEMAQAAGDLRVAGEAFERFANSLSRVAESIAKSLATMSSEFDPFGFKTGFRTVGQQSAMLQQQRELIQALQEREIERLRAANRKLKQRIEKLRQRKPSHPGDSP